MNPKMSLSLSCYCHMKMFNQCLRDRGALTWPVPLANTSRFSRGSLTLQSIETVNVDGSGRYTFPEIFLGDENPVGLAVFESSFFWANKTQLLRSSLHTPKERVVLLTASISAFSILHKSQQPKSKSMAWL